MARKTTTKKKKVKPAARHATKLDLTIDNYWFLKRSATAASRATGRFVSMTSVLNAVLSQAAGAKKGKK